MENEVILKKAIIGGFDRKQVMEYIAYLHSKSNAVKEELDELEGLKSTVAELEAEITEKDNMIERLNSAIADAESTTRLSRASSVLMKESVAYADCYIESAKVLARDISDKTHGFVDDAKSKIDGIMDSLGGISDSILGLYSTMDTLKSEYGRFGEVYPEAELNFIYPQLDTESPTAALKEIKSEAEPEELKASEPVLNDDPFPSEEDMSEFLRRMEDKYRNMLNS